MATGPIIQVQIKIKYKHFNTIFDLIEVLFEIVREISFFVFEKIPSMMIKIGKKVEKCQK